MAGNRNRQWDGYYLKRNVTRFVWKSARFALLLALSFVLLYPVLYMISNALRPYEQTYDPSVIWIPKSVTLDNIKDAIEVLDMWTALQNTLLTAVLTAFIQVGSCLLVGYGFARFNFKGNKVLFSLVLLTMIVPQQTVSTALYSTFRYFLDFILGKENSLNLIDTTWVFWLPAFLGMGLRSGLYIFVYRQFFSSMPHELEEAAVIDGAGPFRTFVRVMLPNAGTVILTVLLFAIVWNWNDYYTPAMYMKNHVTMATALSMFQQNLQTLSHIGGNYTDTALIATRIQAASLLCVAPLLILYAFTQKFFIESVERTGLTGF